MKRILLPLLVLSFLLLTSCEPLRTPPAETPAPFSFYKTEAVPTEPPAASPTEDAAPEPELPSLTPSPAKPTRTPLPTNPPIPAAPENLDPEAMVLIPGGSFLMGCDAANNASLACPESELPQHEVTVAQFLISKYEITNAQYQACVAKGECEKPTAEKSKTRAQYYSDPLFANFPVVNVTHKNAQAYCASIGGRLPTEAEWEFAARGPAGNLYPWGNETPGCDRANSYNNANGTSCVGDTTPVGAYPLGATPLGVMDLAGNVWEWVADYYAPDSYTQSAEVNPTGPASGAEFVVRGGGWSGSWLKLRTSARAYDLSFYSGSDLGFRCVLPYESPYPVE